MLAKNNYLHIFIYFFIYWTSFSRASLTLLPMEWVTGSMKILLMSNNTTNEIDSLLLEASESFESMFAAGNMQYFDARLCAPWLEFSNLFQDLGRCKFWQKLEWVGLITFLRNSTLQNRNQWELIVMVNYAHLMMGNAKIHSYHAKQDFKLSTAPQQWERTSCQVRWSK